MKVFLDDTYLDFILHGACSLKTTFVGCGTLLKSSFTNSVFPTLFGAVCMILKKICVVHAS
jgi:hypothetical protein